MNESRKLSFEDVLFQWAEACLEYCKYSDPFSKLQINSEHDFSYNTLHLHGMSLSGFGLSYTLQLGFLCGG
jgi:hypothetical protein